MCSLGHEQVYFNVSVDVHFGICCHVLALWICPTCVQWNWVKSMGNSVITRYVLQCLNPLQDNHWLPWQRCTLSEFCSVCAKNETLIIVHCYESKRFCCCECISCKISTASLTGFIHYFSVNLTSVSTLTTSTIFGNDVFIFLGNFCNVFKIYFYDIWFAVMMQLRAAWF